MQDVRQAPLTYARKAVGRATDLVGYFWAATDDRTAKLQRIKEGKVFGGWECKSCQYLHSHFEIMDVVCDECGADRVPFIASPDVQVWSPPDEQPRRSPDQRQPPYSPTEQDGASFFWKCKSCQYHHSQFENMEFVCYDCGADRVPFIASPEVQIRSPPDEQPRRSPDQRQPPH